MKYVSINELKTRLDDDGLLTSKVEKSIDSMSCINIRPQHVAIPRVKDNEYHGENSRIVGDDPAHDWLEIMDGCLVYRNLQNGDGTPVGYEFIPTYESNFHEQVEQYITPELVYMVVDEKEEEVLDDDFEQEW